MEINLRAPAKINLQLVVGEKRSDGYHNINSIFAAVDLYDYINIREIKSATSVNCPKVRNRNIAWLAIEVFSKEYGINPNVEISITKNIPVGRGLGGGSSDAAAVLIGLHRMFSIDEKKASELGKNVGSDVTFFFKGGIAQISGRGEIVDTLPFIDYKLLIVSPPYPVSTAWAYKILDESGITETGQESSGPKVVSDLNSFSNTFERIVFDRFPDLYKIKHWLKEKGAIFAQLSGSGSAVYGIFDGHLPDSIPFPDHDIFVCQTINWGVV